MSTTNSGHKRDRNNDQKDLLAAGVPSKLPAASSDEHLEKLFQWLLGEAYALQRWYYVRRRKYSLGSKVSRAAAILFGIAGAILPVLSIISDGYIATEWGYLCLLVGAGTLLFDRSFGLSATWIRYAQIAVELIGDVRDAQLSWELCALSGASMSEREMCLQQLATKLRNRTESETAQWAIDFGARILDLEHRLQGS